MHPKSEQPKFQRKKFKAFKPTSKHIHEQNAFAAFLEQAEKHGNTTAKAELGHCYLKGKGTNKNSTNAVFWLRQALTDMFAGKTSAEKSELLQNSAILPQILSDLEKIASEHHMGDADKFIAQITLYEFHVSLNTDATQIQKYYARVEQNSSSFKTFFYQLQPIDTGEYRPEEDENKEFLTKLSNDWINLLGPLSVSCFNKDIEAQRIKMLEQVKTLNPAGAALYLMQHQQRLESKVDAPALKKESSPKKEPAKKLDQLVVPVKHLGADSMASQPGAPGAKPPSPAHSPKRQRVGEESMVELPQQEFKGDASITSQPGKPPSTLHHPAASFIEEVNQSANPDDAPRSPLNRKRKHNDNLHNPNSALSTVLKL